MNSPLISIAIPTYNRKDRLAFNLASFLIQINYNNKDLVEIHITDDCSSDGTYHFISHLAQEYSFVYAHRNSSNIGLERNLIQCTLPCRGQYLWIFGDDDFLEEGGLDYVINLINRTRERFYLINRRRRSYDLSQVLPNPKIDLDLEEDQIRLLSKLKEVCEHYGIIGSLGFITTNIFLRKPFMDILSEDYFDLILYPHVGLILEAFSQTSCMLVGKKIICQRTATELEKKAFKEYKKLQSFMSDYSYRNAVYFSFKYIKFLNILIQKEALSYEDIKTFPGLFSPKLTHFIYSNTLLFIEKGLYPTFDELEIAKIFFRNTDYNLAQKFDFFIKKFNEHSQGLYRSNLDKSFTDYLTVFPRYISSDQAKREHKQLPEDNKNQTKNKSSLIISDETDTNRYHDMATEYQSLVRKAWSTYHIGNFTKMTDYLAKSLEYSPYTSVETIVNWIEHFTLFAREQGCELNVDKLNDSQEWEHLIKSVVM
jgi:glycosyltransferase involved in cell wall biosynthesis